MSRISGLRFVLEMVRSIITNDLYILGFGALALIMLYRSLSVMHEIRRELDKMPDNPDWARKLRRKLNRRYNVFLALVSIFPLLGMFGTVAALLNLDFSDIASNLDSVKTDFFRALTSTAWGIVFSVGFKLLNSNIAFEMEETLDDIERIVDTLKRGGNGREKRRNDQADEYGAPDSFDETVGLKKDKPRRRLLPVPFSEEEDDEE